ncbi:hypothetical protein [Massilia sp. 9I]|uniref:hypothetical protein n=1 Tax=Massilia sp. 9I TaxID=2653152 RepID=UPI0012EF10E1|nr:hypothetical protein [Massilia sp. 9I]VXB61011.1 hypothetical protein MASSI9I_40113 [Massilia sp. 9I]
MLSRMAGFGQKRTYVENALLSELSHKHITMNPSLSIAANGHVTLEFGDYDSVAYQQVCGKLENELGFSRQGDTVAGLDEGISPSFLRAELEISSGWDNWSGSYLLANSNAGDEILRLLYAELM